MSNFLAFVDEFGNNSFDFNSQGSHFIVAAVICKKDELAELETGIEWAESRGRSANSNRVSRAGPAVGDS